LEIQAGRGCIEGGVHIDASHLGAEFVEKNFPGMCNRCRQFKYDLARGPVPVSPSAHYIMGGAAIDKNCHASRERLFVAGEDTGGVHGANRLGGNGIADSCVFGRQAGKAIARYLGRQTSKVPQPRPGLVKELIARYRRPFEVSNGSSHFPLRDQLRELNWNKVGVARMEPDLSSAREDILAIAGEMARVKISGDPTYNMSWNIYIDLLNMVDVSLIVTGSAQLREETRGAHFRQDYPEQDDEAGLSNIFIKQGQSGTPDFEKRAVSFSRKSAEECRNYSK
ncbi:MAG: FAD-binding protein, partial [Deltaproteobacteria bacterium]|nr:FAD-binding protein [Deltaproteobacteria bacterium]